MKRASVIFLWLAWIAFGSASTFAQRGSLVLFGDVKIDSSQAGSAAPSNITVVLYKDAGGEIGRQNVTDGSRYRFSSLAVGDYELAIEVDNNETTRIRVALRGLSNSPYGFQQDLEFAWKPKGVNRSSVPGVLSAADTYNRSAANKALFEKAKEAVERKKLDQAVGLLNQLLANDDLDFQSWTLLGSLYAMQEKPVEAAQAYQRAIDLRPGFTLALIDLGKLRLSQKKYDAAIEPLTRALQTQPDSGDANYLLGEVYLQLKKGSLAIPYLNKAAAMGRPDAHLRLAWLYHAAGLKDRAATEYREFLKKKPDYADRKKLEDYITANQKP